VRRQVVEQLNFCLVRRTFVRQADTASGCQVCDLATHRCRHLRIQTSVGVQERQEARKRPPAWATASRPSAIEQESSAACRNPAVARQGTTRQAKLTFGAAPSPRNLIVTVVFWLLEEPGCTMCEGFVPHIVRFGSAAEASIFPRSNPIARIHFVFRVDQIL
jgi:hypothetical protein